jgi:16S rRNA (cytosine967-C5)-methyltransferase
MPKVSQNMAEAVQRSLEYIFLDNYYADDVVKKTLQSNPKWGSRDRKFIAKSIYDIVRYKRYYQYLTGKDVLNTEIIKLSTEIYWKLNYPFLELELSIEEEVLKLRMEEAAHQLKIRESIPDWLDMKGQFYFSDLWGIEIHAMNEEAKVYIRANTLKCTADKLQKQLSKEGIESKLLSATVLQIVQRLALINTVAYKDGWFEIQDIGSQKIGEALEVKSNSFVIDACAGAGGKSLQLAALTNNKSDILSMDIEKKKLEELNKRALRAGANRIKTELIDTNTINKYKEKADFLLLDVPCSGLGVLRRKPDDKWKLSPEKIEILKQTQQKILQDYTCMLKKGGVVVYATCSIFPDENSDQVYRFLQNNLNYTLEAEELILPSQGGDGFYWARLKKN